MERKETESSLQHDKILFIFASRPISIYNNNNQILRIYAAIVARSRATCPFKLQIDSQNIVCRLSDISI